MTRTIAGLLGWDRASCLLISTFTLTLLQLGNVRWPPADEYFSFVDLGEECWGDFIVDCSKGISPIQCPGNHLACGIPFKNAGCVPSHLAVAFNHVVLDAIDNITVLV